MDTTPASDADAGRQAARRERLELWREVLARGVEVRLPVHGFSMRPTLKPGDTLIARKLQIPPQPGEIVITEAPDGSAVGHRVIARDCRDGQWRLITAGDSNPGALDDPVSEEALLATVIAVERDGVRADVPRSRLEIAVRLKAQAALTGGSAWGMLSALAGFARRVAVGGMVRLSRLSRVPIMGSVWRGCVPSLEHRCDIETCQVEVDDAGVYHIEAIWRRQVVASAQLWSSGDVSGAPDLWSLREVWVRGHCRERGLASALISSSIEIARGEGAPALQAVIEGADGELREALASRGFEPVSASDATAVVGPGGAKQRILQVPLQDPDSTAGV